MWYPYLPMHFILTPNEKKHVMLEYSANISSSSSSSYRPSSNVCDSPQTSVSLSRSPARWVEVVFRWSPCCAHLSQSTMSRRHHSRADVWIELILSSLERSLASGNMFFVERKWVLGCLLWFALFSQSSMWHRWREEKKTQPCYFFIIITPAWLWSMLLDGSSDIMRRWVFSSNWQLKTYLHRHIEREMQLCAIDIVRQPVLPEFLSFLFLFQIVDSMFFLRQTFPLLVACHKVCALSQPVASSATRQITRFFLPSLMQTVGRFASKCVFVDRCEWNFTLSIPSNWMQWILQQWGETWMMSTSL